MTAIALLAALIGSSTAKAEPVVRVMLGPGVESCGAANAMESRIASALPELDGCQLTVSVIAEQDRWIARAILRRPNEPATIQVQAQGTGNDCGSLVTELLSRIGATTATGGDVVWLDSGESLSGVLVEFRPGGLVVLRTADGELHRYHPSRVRYAGPASQAPAIPSGQSEFTLRLTSPEPTLRFYRHVGTTEGTATQTRLQNGELETYTVRMIQHDYDALCNGNPCTVSLPPGTYRLGVAPIDDDSPVEVEGSLDLRDNTHVEVLYEDRSAFRIIGVLAMIAGGGVALSSPFVAGPSEDTDLFIGLAGLGALGLLTGLVLFRMDDHAELELQ